MRYLALVLSLISWSTWGEVFYVRPSTAEYGSENGASYATAFDGFSDITWAAVDTAGSVDAGDTVYICGTFNASSADGGGAIMLQVGADGAEGEPITFDGDCSAQGDLSQAIIDPQNADAVTQGIKTDARPYINLRNLIIRNIQDDTLALGVQLYTATTEGATAKYINLYNVDVYDIDGSTLSHKCIVGYGTNITIDESDVSGCTDDGIFLQGANNSVTNSRVSRVSRETDGGDCVQITGGAAVAATGALIADSECDHSTVDAKQCYVLGAGTDTETSYVRDTRCLLPIGATVSNGIYTEHDTTYIDRNWVYGGNVGIATGTGAANPIIRGNITTRTTERGISTGSAATGAQVLNNTMHDCNDGSSAGGCVVADANNAGVAIKNNVASKSEGAGIDVQGANVVEQYNVVHDATTPKSTNCSTAGCAAQAGTLDATDIEDDPKFVGGANPTTAEGFKLRPNSPLRRAGTCVYTTGCIPRDFGGRRGRVPPDIGAWQRN